MDEGIVAMMIIVSVGLGGAALAGVLWALKTKQFEDHRRFLEGALDDDEEALNEAYSLEQRQKKFKSKRAKS